MASFAFHVVQNSSSISKRDSSGNVENIVNEEKKSHNEPEIPVDEPEIEVLDLPYLETVETREKGDLYPEIDAYWFLLLYNLISPLFLFFTPKSTSLYAINYRFLVNE